MLFCTSAPAAVQCAHLTLFILQEGQQQQQQHTQRPLSNLLAARAVWLLGTCGQELEGEMWADAISLLAALLKSSDLVVALCACTAASLMAGAVLDDEQVGRWVHA